MSVAPFKRTSAAVVTSILRRRKPAAMWKGNVLVKMKSDEHRSGRFFQACLAQPGFQQRRVIAPDRRHEFPFSAHFLLDLRNVVEIVCESGVDVGKSDRRDVRDDLVGFHTQVFVPNHDIEHTHAMAGNAGFAPAYAGPPAYSVIHRHAFSIKGSASRLRCAPSHRATAATAWL
jgi:hypothetical protein